jgi:hypothetical protein
MWITMSCPDNIIKVLTAGHRRAYRRGYGPMPWQGRMRRSAT